MLIVAALFRLLVITSWRLRNGSRSEYFTQNSGYFDGSPPKSSSRVITGQMAITLRWNDELAWSK